MLCFSSYLTGSGSLRLRSLSCSPLSEPVTDTNVNAVQFRCANFTSLIAQIDDHIFHRIKLYAGSPGKPRSLLSSSAGVGSVQEHLI